MITCERCGKGLTGKQLRWCSGRCSKLGLKSLYRKRNLDRIKTYNNDWRKPQRGGNRPHTKPANKRLTTCFRCYSTKDLQLAHIKPLGAGGTHDNVLTFCRSCHHRFDNLLREFWYTL